MDFFVNYGQKFDYRSSHSANSLFAPHIHPSYELYLCFEQIPRIAMLNGQEIPIDRPCAILYAPYSVHANVARQTEAVYTRHSLYFGELFLTRHQASLNDLPMMQNKNSYVFLLTPECEQELRTVMDLMANTPIRSCRQELLLVYMLRHLHHYNNDNNIVPIDIVHINSPSYIPDVIRYIVENINTPLRISDIAAKFFVCTNKLNRDFKAFTGIAVHQFIIHVKITIAQYELKKPNCSIQEISQMMGFENELYFYAFYKKNTGMTPLQWAKAQNMIKRT